ncbi:DEAD/DEAH box helicase [Bacillus taeanensis]|uniref:ATP-dependent helicase n=1 Tax=Bacillus taeanensis TaxID=273032 RepID=A0A366Y3N6_9BACI|nr:DEAD/DEAH box helicase [Bacillus taeanensis]RBW70801.1 ATP-dependent helicase [Bacillus taeanensis]
MENWSVLSTLQPFLQEAWQEAGFTTPTKVQEQAVPFILEGKDVIAESPTGTGKTVAYLLPILEKIDPKKESIQAVILAPSRELVMQIFEEIQKWTKGSGITPASFIGGANIKRQIEKLKKRPQIIVGTTGRLIELMKMKKIKMHDVKTIVVDEVDQMIAENNLQSVNDIIKSTLKERQVVFFSATVSKEAEEAAGQLMTKSELIRIQKDKQELAKVEHIYFVCERRDKIDVLRRIIRMEELKALAFVNDIEKLSEAASKLAYRGLSLAVLDGESSKREREAAIKDFRADKVSLLLATDVAARGLDIEGLKDVIHFDLPDEASQYTHRSGRTGRMGASGRVISIVTEREERHLKQIARELGIRLEKKTLFSGKMVDKDQRSKFSSKSKGNNYPKKNNKKLRK